VISMKFRLTIIVLCLALTLGAISILSAVKQASGQGSAASLILGVTCDPTYNNRAAFTITNPGFLIYSGTYILSSPRRTGTWSVGPGGTGGLVYGDSNSWLSLYVTQTGETLFMRAWCGPATPTQARRTRYVPSRTPTLIPAPTATATPEILTF